MEDKRWGMGDLGHTCAGIHQAATASHSPFVYSLLLRQVGDKILTINGVDVERVTRHEFVRLFARAAQEEISLYVIHDAAVKILCGDKRSSTTRIKS